MEGYILSIIGINMESGNDRVSGITVNVFCDCVSVVEIRFGIDIEVFFLF